MIIQAKSAPAGNGSTWRHKLLIIIILLHLLGDSLFVVTKATSGHKWTAAGHLFLILLINNHLSHRGKFPRSHLSFAASTASALRGIPCPRVYRRVYTRVSERRMPSESRAAQTFHYRMPVAKDSSPAAGRADATAGHNASLISLMETCAVHAVPGKNRRWEENHGKAP